MAPGAPPLQLSAANLGDIAARGVPVPTFDRSRLIPRIAHIGVGGFHRSHLAAYTHELAESGSDWGIRGLGLLDGDAAMADALHAQDCLYSLIEKGPGTPTTAIVGSIVDYRHTAGRPGETVELLADPTLAIVSMTVTEAGYATDVAPNSTFDLLARSLAERRRTGRPPVTILSCDNLPGNGDAARRVLLGAADAVETGLAGWIEEHCSLPNSMVDRITPVTSNDDRAALLEREGIADRWPVVAEPFRQWVLEDAFVAGRPAWEQVGAVFTDDVHAWELYKLRILNAGHSCIAYLCALAGIVYVHEAMATPEVHGFVERLLAEEAVPALVPSPASRQRATPRRSSNASPTPVSATRSPGCASTAPPSSPRFSSPRSSKTWRPVDRSATPLSLSPGGLATWPSCRATNSRRTPQANSAGAWPTTPWTSRSASSTSTSCFLPRFATVSGSAASSWPRQASWRHWGRSAL